MKDKGIKGIAMAQWVNCLQNNIFVNLPPFPLLYEISGVLHLAQPGLTAGWSSIRLADEVQVNFEIFKVIYIRLVLFNQGTASLQPYQCIPAGFFG